MGKSTSFSEVATGILSLAKIAALVVAGFWTLNNWQKIELPKGKYELAISAAKIRTDIDISLQNFKAGYIGQSPKQKMAALPATEEGAPEQETRVLSAVAVEILLENSRSFPVKYKVTEVSFEIGKFTGNSVKPQWNAQPIGDIKEILQGVDDTVRIIESGGVSQLSLMHFFTLTWCCETGLDPYPKPVRAKIELKLTGIDPETGDEIEGATKERTVGFTSFIAPDFNFVQTSVQVAENSGSQTGFFANNPQILAPSNMQNFLFNTLPNRVPG